jgi:hypothetical protein
MCNGTQTKLTRCAGAVAKAESYPGRGDHAQIHANCGRVRGLGENPATFTNASQSP